MSQDAGKIDRPISIEWIGLDESCPPSVEASLDTPHAVETEPKELEGASNRQ